MTPGRHNGPGRDGKSDAASEGQAFNTSVGQSARESIDISSEDEGTSTEPEEADRIVISILYCYCGESRKGDIIL